MHNNAKLQMLKLCYHAKLGEGSSLLSGSKAGLEPTKQWVLKLVNGQAVEERLTT